MLAHGISTGALFLLVGVLYERRHTREFAQFGGIAGPMPIFATFFVVVAFSSIALPGTNGFIGEFLVFAGAFKYHPAFAAFAVLGAILGAWYMLAAVRRVFFGEITIPANRELRDLTAREIAIMVPLVVAILWMGIGARTFLDPMKVDVAQTVAALKPAEESR
jgi:NADH-quinone oxidoreductase subunit M